MPTNSTDVHLFISDDLSSEATTTIVTVNIVVLVGAVSVFGIASNVINILVFCKQGFEETVNINYTALALSDLLSLVASLFLSIFWNPLFINAGLPLVFVDIQAAFATWPYGCFGRITGWVTAFITFERCLCVVWPLKVKRILTSTVIVNLVVLIYLTMFLTMVPVYWTSLLGWISDPRTNKTILGALITTTTELATSVSYTLHAAIQLCCFFAVLIFTAGLTIRLRQKTRWRTQLTSDQNAASKATRREDKAIKMVTLIATIYVICYLPTIVFLAVTVLHPGFSPKGTNHNVFFVVWSFVILCGVLNSSVNLFVYHHMSSKFKKTCDQMLSRLFPPIDIVKEDTPREV